MYAYEQTWKGRARRIPEAQISKFKYSGFKKTGAGVVPRDENLCSLVNLEYSLVEPNDLKQHICAR